MVLTSLSWYAIPVMGHKSHKHEGEAMTASTARQSLVRATDDGERRWFYGGGLHIWKATALALENDHRLVGVWMDV
jgi:hypothetical protein